MLNKLNNIYNKKRPDKLPDVRKPSNLHKTGNPAQRAMKMASGQGRRMRETIVDLGRYDRSHRLSRGRVAVVCALCVLTLLVGAAAMMKVFASDAPVVVQDGAKTYTFTLAGENRKQVLARAQGLGMPPLGAGDLFEYSEESGSWQVRRLVELHVEDGADTYKYDAHRGDTVAQVLEANGVTLKEADQVSPGLDTVISAALKVQIRRVSRVNITADGQTVQVQLMGGTVADALEQANVKLGDRDTCSHDLAEPVEDDMHLRISRVVNLIITADGRTRSYEVSAPSVAEALGKCRINLGPEDRVNVDGQAQPQEGMRIVVQRVETKEEIETEELEYTTKYLNTMDMAEGKTQLLTPGMKGKKELKYKAVYVDGQLESRELVSEEVTAEPIKELVLRGAGYQTIAPKLEFEGAPASSGSVNSGSSGGTGNTGGASYTGLTVSVDTAAGTLTDDTGKTISFTRAITGTCTAYCIPGGTTSIGLEAVRGVIAVDPDIIPYGTHMYVASPDGQIVYGYGVAGDTGGACMAGDIIADLCYDTIEECSIIGRRDMVLYILD